MFNNHFDLNDMHQTVEETDDEYWSVGENLQFDFMDELSSGAPVPPDDYPVIVTQKRNKDGCTCKKCGEIYPHAEPNQKDGSFKCWSCRNF